MEKKQYEVYANPETGECVAHEVDDYGYVREQNLFDLEDPRNNPYYWEGWLPECLPS